jgi:MFS family permease
LKVPEDGRDAGRVDATLRSVAPSVLLPALLFAVGQGAISPVIALTARDLGASVAVASFVVALNGIGQLLGSLPAGSLTARIGERRAMLVATAFICVALAVCAYASEVWVFGVAILCSGLAASVWGLARQSYLTDAMPVHLRARALSTLGGMQRIGMFGGPFAGALVIGGGGTGAAYLLHVGLAVVAVVLLLSLPDVSVRLAATAKPPPIFSVIRAHLPVLRTLGTATMLVGAVRAARLAIIPLWADRVGLDATTTLLVFGLASAADMLLFYPSGWVMDVHGRVWVAVPSMLLMSGGLLLVPLTSTAVWLAVAATVIGIGNGMSSGLVMTLGADVSPTAERAQFLGAWRLFSGAGLAVGPLVLTAVIAYAGLATAIWTIGGLGLVGALALYRWTPRKPARGH